MPRPSSKKFKPKRRTPVEDASPESSIEIRLQKLLAAAGFGSRRQCEELIIEGRVEVNGKIVDQLGASFDPKEAKVFVDGVALRAQKLVYYAVNKPVGVVTTNSDPQGRPRVIDMVPPTERVFPVGRLDRSSEGLILLTNDGELAQKLAHPKYQIQKVYRVTVAGKVDVKAMKQMEKGIYIAEGFVRVEGAKVLKSRGKATELEVTLREGKNREIRRIFARLGHKVQQLRRIAVGPLRLGEIPIGAYRVLGRDEVKKLRNAAEESIRHAAKEAQEGGRPRGRTSASQDKTDKNKTAARAGATAKPVGSRRATGTRQTQRADSTKSGQRKSGPAKPAKRTGAPPAGPIKTRGIRIDRSPSYEPPPTTGVIIGGEPAEPKPEKRKKSTATSGRGGAKRATKKSFGSQGKAAGKQSSNRNAKKKRRR
ncbi:Ribosomal large subunit pseudouridine synthase B [Novipirellula galeiformis]|uniref:Pseudouridine synthase n=1 Tax=Novipirellula galeiformis TaxID=2528004 RepID=A0A5C6CRQ7_9BACT|nr:pseudouridine synthase [Novipirellula galeiformis]TWU27068.1 Ribosomal large subunit pseudouridine synthase B [Novipirellula galeiformis]